MGAEQNIIVAIEFGSYAICGIAGQRKPDGVMKILGLEIERAAGSVQRGVIYNIDTTTTAIANIVERLGSKLKMRVTKAYVGISGQSMHTEKNVMMRNLETTVKVTPELMDNLKDNNLATEYKDSEILDVIPQEFVIGHNTVTDPVGIQTDRIEARYVNVVARKTLDENIRQCMQKARVEIAGTFISPMALADALLADNEKRSGCALVDFGAETTTVSIYTNNILRSLAVVPLGGGNITADLVNDKQIFQEEAEQLKRKHGIAYVASETDKPQELPITGGRTINENELQNIIGARQEEIIANAWEWIREDSDKLLAGIFITGGAAQIKDMTEAVKHHTEFNCVKMAKPLITLVEVSSGVSNAPQDVSIDTLIALLMCGTDNCVEEKTPPAPTDKGAKTPEPPTNPDDENSGNNEDDNEDDDGDDGEDDGEENEPWWTKIRNHLRDVLKEAEEEEE